MKKARTILSTVQVLVLVLRTIQMHLDICITKRSYIMCLHTDVFERSSIYRKKSMLQRFIERQRTYDNMYLLLLGVRVLNTVPTGYIFQLTKL
jgi:hypothetical protein